MVSGEFYRRVWYLSECCDTVGDLGMFSTEFIKFSFISVSTSQAYILMMNMSVTSTTQQGRLK